MNIINLDDVKDWMVLAAHPDDEIFGPGGSINKYSRAGAKIYVVSFTFGGSVVGQSQQLQIAEQRQKEAVDTDKILGITERIPLNIPGQHIYGAAFRDNKLHLKLVELIRKYRPGVLFTHFEDNHRDHNAIYKITREAALTASEDIREELGKAWRIPALWYYGVEEPVLPSVVVEIGKENLDAKVEALRAQVSQKREGYLERFEQMIRCLAGYWGAKFLGAGRYAEVFYMDKSWLMVVRNK